MLKLNVGWSRKARKAALFLGRAIATLYGLPPLQAESVRPCEELHNLS